MWWRNITSLILSSNVWFPFLVQFNELRHNTDWQQSCHKRSTKAIYMSCFFFFRDNESINFAKEMSCTRSIQQGQGHFLYLIIHSSFLSLKANTNWWKWHWVGKPNNLKQHPVIKSYVFSTFSVLVAKTSSIEASLLYGDTGGDTRTKFRGLGGVALVCWRWYDIQWLINSVLFFYFCSEAA